MLSGFMEVYEARRDMKTHGQGTHGQGRMNRDERETNAHLVQNHLFTRQLMPELTHSLHSRLSLVVMVAVVVHAQSWQAVSEEVKYANFIFLRLLI